MFNKTKELLQLLKLPTNPQTIRTLDAAFGGGGCNDFTLTVEALGFAGLNETGDGGIMTVASNQEYFVYDEESEEALKVVVPWISLPVSYRGGILQSLIIKVDRGCCQDAVQIDLVGENIADLGEYVPLSFEIPEGESSIMIPFVFSSEASFGPKIVGVQAIGCDQNKIKDLYFVHTDPNNTTCPEFISGFLSVYNNFGTWYDLYINSDIAGDYEIEFFINGVSAVTTTGYTNGGGEQIQVNVSKSWDPSAYHYLDIRFTPYKFADSENCGDYCASYGSTGTFGQSLILTSCKPEPYYGMSAIGEDILVTYTPSAPSK